MVLTESIWSLLNQWVTQFCLCSGSWVTVAGTRRRGFGFAGGTLAPPLSALVSCCRVATADASSSSWVVGLSSDSASVEGFGPSVLAGEREGIAGSCWSSLSGWKSPSPGCVATGVRVAGEGGLVGLAGVAPSIVA